jgi:hypothetical protein
LLGVSFWCVVSFFSTTRKSKPWFFMNPQLVHCSESNRRVALLLKRIVCLHKPLPGPG